MGYKKLKTAPIIREPRENLNRPLTVAGYLGRSLVLFLCVVGACLFLGDALGLVFTADYGEVGAPTGAVILSAFLFSAAAAVSAYDRTAAIVSPIASAALFAGALALNGDPAALVWDGVRCTVNTAVHRLADAGFMSFSSLALPGDYHYDEELLLSVGTALLAAAFTVIFSLCLLRRAKLAATAAVCALLLVPVFTYNLTRSVAGIVWAIVFITAALSLCLFDRRYGGREFAFIEKRKKKEDKKARRKSERDERKAKRGVLKRRAEAAYEAALAVTDDRSLAIEAKKAVARLERQAKTDKKKAEKEAAREAKKAAAKAKKEAKKLAAKEKKEAADKRKKQLAAARKDKALAARLAEEKKAKSAAASAERKRIREKKLAERREADAKRRGTFAAGGLAALAAALLALAAVAIPALTVSGKFPEIPFINGPMSTARAYVTAYLTGDDIDLNDLDVYGELNGLAPRRLSFDPLTFRDVQIFSIKADLTQNVYLRSWIAKDFDESTQTWMGASRDEVVEYRSRFGRDFTPDSIRTEFNALVHPTSVMMVNNNHTAQFSDYGFALEKVNVRRINSESKIIFIPAVMDTQYNILEWGKLRETGTKYSFFYDGIYSSRFFDVEHPYSAVSFITDMRDPKAGRGIDGSIRYFDLALTYLGDVEGVREILAIRETPEDEYTEIEAAEDRVYNVSPGDLSDIDEQFKARLKYEGISFTGDSLVKRALADDSLYERMLEFKESEAQYSKYAHETYSAAFGGDKVAELAEKLLADAGYSRDYDRLGNFRGFVDAAGNHAADHDVIMTAIKYLRENCEYTLTPASPEDGGDDVLGSFLFDTKEGYCSHFATAAAALIRAYGYPARFCEGYIAHDFHYNFDDGVKADYTTFVVDRDAHAWIEVYLDGYGWQQYETTPEYAAPMYDKEFEVELPEIVIPDAPTNPYERPASAEKPSNLKPPKQSEAKEDEDSGLDYGKFFAVAGIVVGSLVVLAIALRVVWSILAKRAAKETKKRRAAVDDALSEERKNASGEENRALALELNDQIMSALSIAGLEVEDGEGAAEFAERVDSYYGGIADAPTAAIFDIMMRAEFGTSLDRGELRTLGDFASRLVPSVYDGLSPAKKLKYRYFKRKI